MTFEESTTCITRIANLQSTLLDHTGHVYRGTPRAEARSLVAEINSLRERVGWRPLDMTGRWHRR